MNNLRYADLSTSHDTCGILPLWWKQFDAQECLQSVLEILEWMVISNLGPQNFRPRDGHGKWKELH